MISPEPPVPAVHIFWSPALGGSIKELVDSCILPSSSPHLILGPTSNHCYVQGMNNILREYIQVNQVGQISSPSILGFGPHLYTVK